RLAQHGAAVRELYLFLCKPKRQFTEVNSQLSRLVKDRSRRHALTDRRLGPTHLADLNPVAALVRGANIVFIYAAFRACRQFFADAPAPIPHAVAAKDGVKLIARQAKQRSSVAPLNVDAKHPAGQRCEPIT